MTIVCWTVIKQAVAPVAHAAGAARHIGHVVRHAAGPRLHHAILPPRAWITTVCTVSVIGGGLLVPLPAAPPSAELPQAVPEPITYLWMPLESSQPAVDDPTGGVFVPPNGPDVPAGIETPPTGAVPEPASLFMLLVGAVCVAVLRWRHVRSRPGSPQ